MRFGFTKLNLLNLELCKNTLKTIDNLIFA